MSDEPLAGPIPEDESEEVEQVPAGSGWWWWGMVTRRACTDQTLSRGALRTLVLLGTYASKRAKRYAWPKQVTMVDKLKVSRSSVRKYLDELELKGYILRVEIPRQDEAGRPLGGKRHGYYLLGLPGGIDDPHGRAEGNGTPEVPLGVEDEGGNGTFSGGNGTFHVAEQWHPAPHESAHNRAVELSNLEQTINRRSLRESQSSDPDKPESFIYPNGAKTFTEYLALEQKRVAKEGALDAD